MVGCERKTTSGLLCAAQALRAIEELHNEAAGNHSLNQVPVAPPKMPKASSSQTGQKSLSIVGMDQVKTIEATANPKKRRSGDRGIDKRPRQKRACGDCKRRGVPVEEARRCVGSAGAVKCPHTNKSM